MTMDGKGTSQGGIKSPLPPLYVCNGNFGGVLRLELCDMSSCIAHNLPQYKLKTSNRLTAVAFVMTTDFNQNQFIASVVVV